MRVGIRETLFSVNCFAAAMLALYVSFSIGLERPFWAMATVYITSQPLSGAVRSKAVFRLAGTMVGAAVTVALVPPLSNAPVLLTLALATWVAVCQFVSLLDRTPRSYMFMLAGYTAALIGFPSVGNPGGVFDTAVLRSEEIAIGVSCAAFIHSIVFPRSVTALLQRRINGLIAEAEAWIVDALAIAPPDRTAGERRRLAADLSELHSLAVHVPFDTAERRPTQTLLAALQDRLMILVPLVSAVEDRIQSLTALGPPAPEIAALHEDIRAWVRQPDADVAIALKARCTALAEAQEIGDWAGLLRLNLLDRLGEMVDVLSATRLLACQFDRPALRTPPEVTALLAARRELPLHRDYVMMALSTAATFFTILACCAFWIETAWPEGSVAAMMAAVVCCFFGTMDDPVPAQRGFLIWISASLPIAALYIFAILPRVTDFVTMVLVLAPLMLLLGALMALPRWYSRMMPMIIGVAGGMSLTNDFRVDAPGFFNGNVAQLAGMAAAIVVTRLVRSMGADTAIGRLRAAGWRDLSELAAAANPAGIARWTSRMLDRVGLIAGRVGESDADGHDAASATLRELRVGVNLSQIGTVPGTERIRADIGRYFAKSAPRREPPEHELLDSIDATIDAQRIHDSDPEGRRVLAALTGLRRNFFPAAPAWQPREIAA